MLTIIFFEEILEIAWLKSDKNKDANDLEHYLTLFWKYWQNAVRDKRK